MAKQIENFNEKKESLMETRNRLKATGRPFTLQDVLDNTDGLVMVESKEPEPLPPNLNAIVGGIISGGLDHELLLEYYEIAKKKYNDVSEMIPISEGVGFTYTKENKVCEIYYCLSSECMMENFDGVEHEVARYEL